MQIHLLISLYIPLVVMRQIVQEGRYSFQGLAQFTFMKFEAHMCDQYTVGEI